jgi:hypothetical protein
MTDRKTMLRDLKKIVSHNIYLVLSHEDAPLKDIQCLHECKMREMKLIEESELYHSVSRFNELTGLDIETGNTTFLLTLSDIQKIVGLICLKKGKYCLCMLCVCCVYVVCMLCVCCVYVVFFLFIFYNVFNLKTNIFFYHKNLINNLKEKKRKL